MHDVKTIEIKATITEFTKTETKNLSQALSLVKHVIC